MAATCPVTIVCATLNARDAVRLTFESLARCTPEPKTVLVADNGSTDGALEYLQTQDWLSVVPLIARPSASTDHGSTLDWLAARVDTPYFMTLDSDVEFTTAGWLTRTLELARRDGLAALGVEEPALGAYRARLAPFALLLETATFRALDTSFQSFVRVDDPEEAARWRARPRREQLELSELQAYRTAAVYPTGAAIFEQLQQRGVRWASMPEYMTAWFQHLGHMSWAQAEPGALGEQHLGRQAYIRARLASYGQSG